MKEINLGITGIGSLPHINVDSALDYSFEHDLVFLPQLNKLNYQEFMVYQSISKIPGLKVSQKLETTIIKDKLINSMDNFNNLIESAINDDDILLSNFLPDKEYMSSLNSFFFEIEERNIKKIKLQLAGPLTCLLLLKDEEGNTIKDNFIIEFVSKVILISSLALIKKFKTLGCDIIFIYDEPSLNVLLHDQENSIKLFNFLTFHFEVLSKHADEIGIHCCSNPDWHKVCSLKIDYISIDNRLSLMNLFDVISFDSFKNEMNLKIIHGLIPTNIKDYKLNDLFNDLLEDIKKISLKSGFSEQEVYFSLFNNSYISTSCGLSLNSIKETEYFLRDLLNLKLKISDKVI
jgi:methionine synthase II (cobalamin-independent)